MTTIAKDFAAKFAIAAIAVAMIFTAFSAKAATSDDTEAQIAELLKQVAALQAKLGDKAPATSSASVCPYTWTRDLKSGATGADVMNLQKFLNADPDTRVAATGTGSAGMETQFFGPATGAAVAKYQMKYRADILTPAGLVSATQFFGPSTRAYANAHCTAGTDGDDDEEATTGDLTGEASLNKFETSSASDDDVEEGAEDAEIAEVKVKFVDGDALISRLDLALESAAASGDETDPWDTFDNISVWVDGDKVAEVAADDRDEYLDDDAGTLRISGLDIVAEEDDEVTLTIAATVQDGVDGVPNTWTVEFDAMRYFDADDVASTDTTTGDLGDATGESFTVVEQGGDDELAAKTSSNDPDSSTLELKDDAKSDWYTVFAFDLDTKDSVNDITLNSIKLNVATTGATYSALVDDAELVIDGTTIDDVTVTYSGSTAVLTFNVDGDVVIDAGDRVEAELMLRFKALASGSEGATIQASISSLTTSIVDAEGADDLGNDQLSGGVTGDVHTLRTTGVTLKKLADTSASYSLKENSTTDATDDQGVYTFKFDVTAFDGDFYFNKTTARGTTGTTEAAEYLVESAGSTVTTGTTTASITSTADTVDSRYVVHEGDTETFTLTVTYDPATAGFYSLQLNNVNYYTASTGGSATAVAATPAEDFDTDEHSI